MTILASGNFVTSEIKQVYQDTITALRNDLGHDVVLIYEPIASGCPNCIWDSINRKSSSRYNVLNPYPSGSIYNQYFVDGSSCPVCFGHGQINQAQSGVYKAMVRWFSKEYERPGLYGGEDGLIGNVPRADVRIKISYSGHNDLARCKGAIIDGMYCNRIEQPIHRGIIDPFVSVALFRRQS